MAILQKSYRAVQQLIKEMMKVRNFKGRLVTKIFMNEDLYLRIKKTNSDAVGVDKGQTFLAGILPFSGIPVEIDNALKADAIDVIQDGKRQPYTKKESP